jgi:hypothetical protein
MFGYLAAPGDRNESPARRNRTRPIKIVFFKKQACDAPTPQGFRCTFDVKVASRNIGASMYNNISFAFFYKDKETGKWAMRPPF